MSLLRETVLTPDYVMEVVEQANASLTEVDSNIEGLLAEATRQAKAAQKKVETVVELMGKKGVTSILESQYDAANRSWLEATAQFSRLKAQAAQSQTARISFDDAQQFLDEMLATLSTGPVAERQVVVARFVDRVVVYPGKADVTLKFRLDTLTATFDGYWPRDGSGK